MPKNTFFVCFAGFVRSFCMDENSFYPKFYNK